MQPTETDKPSNGRRLCPRGPAKGWTWRKTLRYALGHVDLTPRSFWPRDPPPSRLSFDVSRSAAIWASSHRASDAVCTARWPPAPQGALFHFMQPMSDRSREPILELAVEIERIRRGSFEVAGDNDSSCAEG